MNSCLARGVIVQASVKYADLIGQIRVPFVIDHMGRVRAEAGPDQEPFRHELMCNRSHR